MTFVPRYYYKKEQPREDLKGKLSAFREQAWPAESPSKGRRDGPEQRKQGVSEGVAPGEVTRLQDSVSCLGFILSKFKKLD